MTPYANATTNLPMAAARPISSGTAPGPVSIGHAGGATASATGGPRPLGGDSPDEALQAGRDYVQWGGTAVRAFDTDIARRAADLAARRASGATSGPDFDAATRKLGQRQQLRDMLAGHLQRMQHILSEPAGGGSTDDVSDHAAPARSLDRHAREVASRARAVEAPAPPQPSSDLVAAAYLRLRSNS